MHTLIVGDPHVGKSTLIRRVLAEADMPVFGFETKKEEPAAGESESPVYIYEAGKAHIRSEDNLIGRCGDRRPKAIKAAFDRFAKKLADPPQECIVLMDEIGVMESCSPDFCRAVMTLLDGGAPVIAAVKSKSSPFLDAVKQHPHCRCFLITQENRDALYEDVLRFVKAQTE